MAEDHRYQVNINAVPEDFGLVKTKKLILDKLDDRNAIAKIAYFQNDDQSLKKSVIVVILKTADHVKLLLENAKIEFEFKDSLHTILLTKPRIASICQEPNPQSTPKKDVPSNKKDMPASTPQQSRTPRSKVRSYPDLQVYNDPQGKEKEDANVTQTNVRQQQRSLYVTRIPNHMYNENVLREHFERFGSVARVIVPRGRSTRYAIVSYGDHKSAVRALQLAADIRPCPTNLRLAWDSKEADRLKASVSEEGPASRLFREHPPRRERRDRSMPSREVSVASSEQISWSTICQLNSDTFRGSAGRTILVQGIPHYIDNYQLRSYFENDYLSGGGPVVGMAPLVDGVLIEFKDKSSVDNILKQAEHVIDSNPLRVYRKPMPLLCKDRFIVKGMFTSIAAVKGLLECCDHTTKFTVTEHLEPNSFFVKCPRPLDIKGLANLMARASLDVKATVHELCRTDCVLVEGLGRDVTDDMIKLLFMNRKKTNGGDVTAVKRNMDRDRAVVYFANFRDAENVVQKSKKDPITIGDNEVSVSLCHGGLGMMQRHGPNRNVNKPKQAPRAAQKKKAPPKEQGIHLFNYVPECDNDIIEYIVRSQGTYKELRNNISNLAHLDFESKPPAAPGTSFRWVAKLKPVPKKNMEKSVQNDQGVYESSCASILVEFFSRFQTESCQLNADKLKSIRRAYVWNEEVDFIKAEIEVAESYPAFVRWNTLRDGTKVTGYPHHVSSIIDWLKQCCDHSSADQQFTEKKFELLLECDIISDVEKDCGSVHIKVDREFRKLTFKGRTDAVDKAKSEIGKRLTCIKESNMTFLDRNQLSFLKEVLEEADSDVVKLIKLRFRSSSTKAVLRCDPDPVLLYKERRDLTQAMEILNDLIVAHSIAVKKKYDEVVQSQEWRRLEQTIRSQCRLYKDKQTESITVVGFNDSVQDACRQISEHINDNVEKKTIVSLDSSHARFLTTFPKESGAEVRLKDINWQVTSMKTGTLSLKGKAVAVSEAVQWLQQENKAIITASEVIEEPGMAGYFCGKKGEQFLQTTQTVSKCVIQLDTEARPTSPNQGNSTFMATSSIKKSVKLCSVKIPRTNVIVNVLKEDITDNNSDAIVNPSNETLKLHTAGIAGAILRKGGASIQREMEARRRIVGGTLQPGSVVVTSGGKLSCQKIIHVSGPVWTNDNAGSASQCLSDCVAACLGEANGNDLQSIAIPAISCGDFGGPITACSNLIVNAVLHYFHNNPSSSITEVNLVEMQRDDVLEEFKKALTNIKQNNNHSFFSFVQTMFGNRGSASTNNQQPRPSTSRLPSSPQISILQKDIASHTADVIVTCTPPSHFASAQGSSISIAILKKAGKLLQRTCQQMAASSQLQSGEVLETPGFGVGCQKIYHILLDKRVAVSSIPGVIKKCLLMAENSGYSRIAFPAIGTGGMGYHASLVASSLKREIDNFKGAKLRNVDIILFPSDQSTINEFNKVFGSSQARSPVLPVVSVQQGDISQSHCDAVVNTTTGNFELITSPLSQLIVNRAGNSIITECQTNPKYSGTNFRVTSGGNLNCKFLVHVVPPGDTNALIPILTSILTLIDATMKLSSVAIPAIGSGKAGLSSTLVAKAMQTAFQNLQASKPQHLKKIEVVIFDTNIIQEFQTNITTGQQYTTQAQTKQQSPQKPFVSPKPKKITTFKIPVESQTSSEDQVRMLLCSNTQSNVDEARRRIGDHVKEKSLRKTKDVDIESFGEEVEEEVMALEKKHNVMIRRRQTAGTSIQLVISGLKDGVMEAYTSATELIQEYKQALICAENVIWKYRDPRINEFSDFSLTASFQIETAYKKDPKSTFNIIIFDEGKKRTYSINLTLMTETSLERNDVTKIVRSQKSSVENFPPEWEDIGDKPFKNVRVASNSQEYKDVLAIFNATGSIRRPVSLKRLQNPTLYHQFQAQKRKVEARMKAKGSTLPVTRQLFHGTTEDVCASIYKDGFDRSHCGKNATMYGKGVYFATSCQYSQSYAQADAHRYCRMFLAEVITGEFHQGDPSLRTPHFMDTANNERYDSVVDQMNQPGMFVVFKDASVYPAYILKYKT